MQLTPLELITALLVGGCAGGALVDYMKDRHRIANGRRPMLHLPHRADVDRHPPLQVLPGTRPYDWKVKGDA